MAKSLSLAQCKRYPRPPTQDDPVTAQYHVDDVILLFRLLHSSSKLIFHTFFKLFEGIFGNILLTFYSKRPYSVFISQIRSSFACGGNLTTIEIRSFFVNR